MVSKELQSELREKYNPEGSILREHQKRMLSILEVVADICEREGIQYWLTHGTLLGAARHGGFIPWDDDLDICIFRKDIRKFREIMISELPDNLVLQCHQTDKNYYHPYYKIRDLNSEMNETGKEDLNYRFKGIFIDIFPLEKNHLSWTKITYSVWGRVLYGCILPKPLNPVRLVINRFLYFSFSILFQTCRILEFLLPSKTWNLPYGCYIDYAPGGFIDKDIIPPHTNNLVKFEGRVFLCPNDVNSYLTALYGDYNKLPNLEKIHHHITDIKIWN